MVIADCFQNDLMVIKDTLLFGTMDEQQRILGYGTQKKELNKSSRII